MADEWPVISLREAGVRLFDCEHRTPPAAQTGYPYIAIPQLKNGRIDLADVRCISPENFINWTRKTNPQPWDVIVSRRCNPGETAYIPPGLECALGQNLVLLRADGQKVVQPFLRWLLRSPAWWDQVRCFINVGAVFDSLKCIDIPNFLLPIPPKVEQQAIACILGALDDKIELNRRTNQTLEATARAVFKSWFVDFDPVRAKAAGQQSSGLATRIADLFPDSLEESEFEVIPSGWKVSTVDAIAHINARTLARRDSLDVIDYVEISEVVRGDVGTITRYQRGKEPSRARRRLQHGDTALSTVRPDRGSYFLCLNPPETLIASTGFAVFTPKDGNWAFLHAMVTKPEFGQELGRLADGGAYPAIRPEVIGGREVVLPDNSQLITAFDRIVQPLLLRAEMNRNENRALAELRDALLPKLISGDLRVPDAERLIKRNL
jgi:type I restriction enzyme S subunit